MTEENLDVIILDHYDSFTHNLVSLITETRTPEGQKYVEENPEVILHDQTSVEELKERSPDAIVISPGPGHPENSEDIETTDKILKEISPKIPTFGVCLGLEAAIHVYGGKIGKTTPIHGKSSEIKHDEQGSLEGLKNEFKAGRYHSLVVQEVPESFEVTATAEGPEGEELVMAAKHREYPIEGVQFHPESILTLGTNQEGTTHGEKIISNFLQKARKHKESEV